MCFPPLFGKDFRTADTYTHYPGKDPISLLSLQNAV